MDAPETAAVTSKGISTPFRLLKEYASAIGFLLLFVVLSLSVPNFFSTTNLINVARQVSVNAIMAVGMTFVIISGGIDLSVGSVVALSGVTCAFLAKSSAGPVVAILVTLGLGAWIGFLNGFVITRARIPPFIATMAMLSIARGAALLVSGGTSVSSLGPIIGWIGRGYVGQIPVPVFLMLAVFLVGHYVLSQTRLGTYTYAIGGNERVAEVVGIPVNRVKIVLYVLSGILATVSSLILTSRLDSGQPLIGQGYEMDAVASVVLGGASLFGGTGHLIGTFFGASIIGILTNGLTLLNLSFYYQLAVKGLIIIIAVWIGKERTKTR